MRWIGIVALVSVGVVGCSLDEVLDNAPCNVDDDCVGGQTCYFTQSQSQEGAVGRCSDGSCVPGLQEGCVADAGSCNSGSTSLVPTPFEPQGGEPQYCCPGNSLVINGDGNEALCVSADVEDSECSTTGDCAGGQGFTCVRTKEQDEEPQETNSEEQVQEPGFCRPGSESEATCSARFQEGCRSEEGCANSMLEKCAGTRCYCCDSPANSSFTVHVYEEADNEGTSAACVECPSCPQGSPCTELEDSTCVVTEGVCGCTPVA